MGLRNWFKTAQEPTAKDIENRVRDLEADLRRLRLEWEEVYDKVSAAVARHRKRDRDAEKAASSPPTAEMDPQIGEPVPLSKAELRRRFLGVNNGL